MQGGSRAVSRSRGSIHGARSKYVSIHVTLGVYSLTNLAYGRWDLPNHPPHFELLNDPSITHRYRRVFLRPETDFKTTQEFYDSTEIINAEDVSLRPEELQTGVEKGGRWVFYIVFEMPEAPKQGWAEDGRGRGRDLMLVHGKNLSVITPIIPLKSNISV